MLNDLDIITKRFPADWDSLHLYAIGDVHVGSEQFDEESIKRKLQIIHDDPVGVFVVCGDLGDYGLKNSKTNVYKATMQPKEQQEYIFELFRPVADKLVGAVAGNHEERITKEVGLCPLYDLCVRWGNSDVYRENVAIVKLSFGVRSGSQQNSFCGIVTHGATRTRHKKFIACFDGIDFAISGHTHTPEYSPHGKIRVNSIKNSASVVTYKELVVDANLKVGGYGIKKEYEIPPQPELQYLELKGYREPNATRKAHKLINYHSIQI